MSERSLWQHGLASRRSSGFRPPVPTPSPAQHELVTGPCTRVPLVAVPSRRVVFIPVLGPRCNIRPQFPPGQEQVSETGISPLPQWSPAGNRDQ